MAAPRFLSDLAGTALSYLRIGLTTAGVRLKAVTGGLVARDSTDSADAPITGSQLRASGDSIEINSDAAGSSADWKYTLQRPATGMTAAVTLTLPVDDGSPGQVMQTDGAGGLSFVTPSAGSANGVLQDDSALAFGDASPKALFTKPTNSSVPMIRVVVTTPFNGTAPLLSIGITGTTSKYMGTTEVNLKEVGVYEVFPGVAVEALAENLIATYAADSSSAGAARIEIHYVQPT